MRLISIMKQGSKNKGIISHARDMKKKFNVPAYKRSGLTKYYLHTVKQTLKDAEKVATGQRKNGYTTWIFGFTKKQGGRYGIYITP